MEHDLAARGRLVEHGGIQDRAFEHANPVHERIQTLAKAGREIVQHDDLIPAVEQSAHEVMSNETGTAGDQCPHVKPPFSIFVGVPVPPPA